MQQRSFLLLLLACILCSLVAHGFNDTLSHHYSFSSLVKQKKDTLFIPDFYKYNGTPISKSPNPVLISATQVISLYVKPAFYQSKWNNGHFHAKLKGRVLTGQSGNMNTLREFTLTVDYAMTKNAPYKAKDLIVHTLTKENTYTILEIDETYTMITDANGNIILPEATDDKESVFYVGNQILYDRVYSLTENLLNIQGPIEKKSDPTTGNHIFLWKHHPNAEEYDFEWNYIDDYTGSTQKKSREEILNIENRDYIRQLKKQSARVTLKDSFYVLPAAFESGYLLIRIRANGKRGQEYKQPINGKWKDTLISVGNTNTYIPGNDKMNWQYQGFFSDDGNRKDMIIFADGTLRQRQALVALNTEKNILVSETIYDHQGRPAIQVLPSTPQSSSSPAFKYYNNFNRNLQNLQYSRTDFDTSSNRCGEKMPSHMHTISGAGRYYGSSLENTNSNPFIASAEGYPFTQTSYTPDPTGRIRASGLAGIHHQIGNGHFKSYEYANPTQQELDTLFGNNIGNAVFYDKESLTDENGQMMITYKDSKGNIIATAFSGRTPGMMDPLQRESKVVTVNFLEENNIADSVSNTIIASKNLLLPKTTDLTIRLSLVGEKFKVSVPGWADSLCMDCVYDLELTIQNSCGTVYLEKKQTVGNLADDSIFTCQQNEFIFDSTLLLAPDKYTIYKKITINKTAQEKYEAAYLALMYTDTIRRRIFESIPPNRPDVICNNDDCKPCKYDEEEIQTPEGNKVIIQHKRNPEIPCNEYCSSEISSPCQGAMQAMLQDMSPGGQYGEYNYTYEESGETAVQPFRYKLSVYNTNNQLGGSDAIATRNYKHPVFPYRDLNGTESRVAIYDENGNFDKNVLPESLSVKEFIRHWQPSWAASLVPYHPEYCYYMWCLKNENIISYSDKLLMQSPDPQTLEQIIQNDPLSETGSLPQELVTALDKFYAINNSNYLNVKEVAMAVVHCNGITEINEFSQCAQSRQIYSNDVSSELHEKEWFYLKSFYVMVRKKYLDAQRKKYVTEEKGCMTNDCIGQNTFSGQETNVDPVLGTYNENPTTFEGTSIPAFESLNNNCCTYSVLTPHPINITTNIIQQSTVSASLCTILKNKRKIFYETDDVFDYIDTSKLKENSNETIYNNCGKCLEAFQLELLLNALASSQQLTREIILPGAPPLVLYPELVSHFNASETGYYLMKPILNAQTNSLSLLFQNSKNLQESFRVSLFGSETIFWDSIANISCFETIDKHTFTIQATYQSGKEVHLKGTTDYIDFISCKPPPVCKLTTEGSKIKNIISYILKRPNQYLSSNSLVRLPDSFSNSVGNNDRRYKKVVFWRLSSRVISGNSEIVRAEIIQLTLHPELLLYLSRMQPNGLAGNLFAGNPISIFNFPFENRLSTREQSEILARIIRLIDEGNIPSRYKKFLSKCKINITNPESQNNIFSFKDYDNFEFLLPDGKEKDICEHRSLTLRGSKKTDQKTGSLYISVSCASLANCCLPVKKHPLCCLPPLSIKTFPVENNCENDVAADAGIIRIRMEEEYFRLRLDSIRKAYFRKCFGSLESLIGSYADENYHFTLYYYDRAGNLVQTVPPAGIVPLTASQMNNTRNHRRNSTILPVVNEHRLTSYYRYNSLNQPVSSATPDGGITHYSYDEAGRTILTLDAEHKLRKRARYLLYDAFGRIIESGECDARQFLAMESNLGLRPRMNYAAFANIIQNDPSRREITKTIYDSSTGTNLENWFSNTNKNLRNRIGAILLYGNLQSGYEHATYYSYDIHGNIREMVQEYAGLARQYPHLLNGQGHIKKFDYEYDLTSQKLHTVIYQKGKPDEFIQRYSYDADNRLITVKTAIHAQEDTATIDTDATYRYFPHGQVSRMEIGKDKIQGFDYAYTVNGWLKAVNGDGTSPTTDMGKDGGMNQQFAADAAGFTLGYYVNDYTPVSGNITTAAIRALPASSMNNRSLYNGNIAYQLQVNNAFTHQPFLCTQYRYDQLNRLKDMQVLNGLNNPNQPIQSSEQYRNSFTYDANGNILTQTRKGIEGSVSDALSYHYNISINNQLLHVSDTVNNQFKQNDVDNQFAGNYRYDDIGRLISDRAENIEQIKWANHHKPLQIIKSNRDTIEFSYDALNNRISKRFRDTSTWYVKDFSGNTIASYKLTSQGVALDEFYIYGKDRIGTYRKSNLTGTTQGSQWRGEKNYEFSNHLGNVLAVFSDLRILKGANVFDAQVVQARDYYPYGMEMEGRSYTLNSYKFGFNGFENDDEVKGKGNHLSLSDYCYDSRLGRRWQLDPIIQYGISGYSSFNNNPIFYLDPSGESAISIFVKQVAKSGLKKAAKETVEVTLKAKLKSYTSKGWAKQIGSDALDAIDLASSQTWWEYAIEFIPVAGDAYGASKLGEKGYRIYKITQKFESIAEWAGKAAGKAFKRLGPNILTGKGSDRIEFFTKKFNNQGTHLTESDLGGAVKEIYGLKSGIKEDGITPYQHLKEVQESLDGMGKQIEALRKEIKKGAFEGDSLKAAEGILRDVTNQYNEINNTLDSARKAANNF